MSAERIAAIHAKLVEYMAEEERLMDELAELGDKTYQISDEAVKRTRDRLGGIVENVQLRGEVATATLALIAANRRAEEAEKQATMLAGDVVAVVQERDGARKQQGREASKRETTVRHTVRLERAHIRTTARLRTKVADCNSLKALLGPDATKEWTRLRADRYALDVLLPVYRDAAANVFVGKILEDDGTVFAISQGGTADQARRAVLSAARLRDRALSNKITALLATLELMGARVDAAGRLHVDMPKYHAAHRCEEHQKRQSQALDACVPCLQDALVEAAVPLEALFATECAPSHIALAPTTKAAVGLAVGMIRKVLLRGGAGAAALTGRKPC